ncbi:glycosyltransferase [Clostridium perfringens]|uniref:glycosyltransferase n=1 Tax=Clostridium perfringens TaxID=1502 RepID=UPI0024BC55F7|nr:glycosyltransferase [Clostridium perfringens]EJT5933918.1 glycosyltransferase [Clostridium perfringens]MDM0876779.1 glycosyltransferase [Clostridium perfringens]MDM0893462.1 glycosyltransferase [Clostridium perfringens]HEE9817754.1 glycosyltransferase [Clostridium perfringens]HEO1700352.1 glycosyltransferase [Clostridium perfringens]
MKNLIYVAYSEMDETDGIYKKIVSQCIAFDLLGYKTYLYVIKNHEKFVLYRIDQGKIIEEKLIERKKTRMKSFLRKKILQKDFLNSSINIIKEKNIEYVYIRKLPLSNMFLQSLKKIKNCCEKVVCEIPTYPYYDELKNMNKWQNLIIEKLNFIKFTNSVDNITVILSKDINLSNKFIKIQNGIPKGEYKISKSNYNNKKLNLLGLGYIYNYHGYDRVLKGISEFNKIKDNNLEINFHIVGDGPEINNLKKITDQLNLQKNVIFYGTKSGIELDEIFDFCNIGIGSLGIHRKNAEIDTSIKIKEFAFRGLPFIISGNNDYDLPNTMKKVEANDNPINMNEIILFYESLKNINYKRELREYSEKNFKWEKILNEVF